MAYNVNISPGAPPLLWSNIQEAFDKINANFEIINIVAGGALTPLDFSNLNSSVIPATTNTFQLGSDTAKWKSLYVDNYSTVPGNEYNGVWLGTSQIKGIGGVIDLPANSTVNGDLIINPDKTFFKTAQVDFNNQVVANSFSDTLNFVSGISMQLVVDSSAESITFNNTGVLSLTGTAGQIGISASTGNITLTNLGVLSLTSTTALPSGRTAGAGINIDNATGSGIKITNTGVLDIQNGFGITVSTDDATGVVTITNSAPAQVTFRNYVIGGDTSDPIVADTTSDTMNINSGYGISLTKNSATDSFTIALADRIDLKGSVFGDDSSLMVDSVDHKMYASGGFIGNLTGNASTATLATTATTATTVSLVATNTTAATHYITFVDTATGNENVRTDTDLTYNPSTNTLTVGTLTASTLATGSLTITGSTIGTTDSSGIIINELTTFNTDVTFENDITILQSIFVRGSRVILLNDFKSLVAASTSFADFQTKIAALE